jgi:hypothetical protein
MVCLWLEFYELLILLAILIPHNKNYLSQIISKTKKHLQEFVRKRKLRIVKPPKKKKKRLFSSISCCVYSSNLLVDNY